MRTRIIFTLCIVLGISSVFAQEAGKIRAGLEAGCLVPIERGFGFLGAIELKYNLKKNMNVGLKTEITGFWKSKSHSSEILSFSVTYDYYFNTMVKRSSTFLGAGFGFYFCDAGDYRLLEYEDEDHFKFNNPTCFIRAGYEIRKIRLSLSYNLIRKTQAIYYSFKNNDYVSLNIGFYLGGGKWK